MFEVFSPPSFTLLLFFLPFNHEASPGYLDRSIILESIIHIIHIIPTRSSYRVNPGSILSILFISAAAAVIGLTLVQYYPYYLYLQKIYRVNPGSILSIFSISAAVIILPWYNIIHFRSIYSVNTCNRQKYSCVLNQ